MPCGDLDKSELNTYGPSPINEIMRFKLIAAVMASVVLCGCGGVRLDPTWNEVRAVTPATDFKKTVTVPEGMVFYDTSPASRGIRFPEGTYVLEAEDADYFYFRSTRPLEFHIFKDGQQTDARNIPGGIMMAKHFSLIPAAAYIDGDKATERMAVWKLGDEFLRVRGRYWTKNF
jgi:hypothetical protein